MNRTNIVTIAERLGLPAAVLCAAMANPSAAAHDPGWYFGGNIGLSTADIDNKGVIRGLLSEGFTTTSFRDDVRASGYKLFGGYRFGQHFAVEAGYFDLGEFGFEAATVPSGSLSGTAAFRGVNVDAVGVLPFTHRLSAFGLAGVQHAEAKTRFVGTGAVNVSDSKFEEQATRYKFGLGLEYNLTASLALRAQAENYRINDAIGNNGDVQLYSVGLVYRLLEDNVQTTPATAVTPPVPAPTSSPPPLVPERIMFSAESLFDFDSAVIKPSGRQQLDQFSANLRGPRFEEIQVTGHTDRLGSQEYNLKLSSSRADAVKDYLVRYAGIPAAKIVTRGINGSSPVTKPDECIGSERTKKLIACLQPDRRVEVEVTATK
ncbi:MAG: OmpA family protein [Pseudomonadota bacterium]|nr:OmpA family protein [Pseudomonadota bacterium]